MNDPTVRLQPMVHVADMAASIAFYEALGGRQLQLAAPGGMLVKVNELEPELYT